MTAAVQGREGKGRGGKGLTRLLVYEVTGQDRTATEKGLNPLGFRLNPKP